MSVLDSGCISAIADSDRLEQLQFVSFDVETTGLSPVVARLVELSGVKFKLGSDEVSTFSSLIDPEVPIPPEVSQIHGITDDMVAGEPKCQTVVSDFLNWIGSSDTIMVAHNAPFDVDFLHVAIARMQGQRPGNFVIDTLPFSRAILADAPNHQLKTLVEYFSLEAGGYHRALADSHHVRNVLTQLISRCEIETWGQLADQRCHFRFDQDLYSFEPPEELLESIASINDAIANGMSLTFVYSGYRTFKRTVDPVALIQSRGNYYLTAYCKKACAERTFRLDKVSQLKATQTGTRKKVAAEAAS